jgi:hypothetical protein
MPRVIAIIAAVLAIGVAMVLAIATTGPDSFRVQRSMTVKAPPETIFPLIADFRGWVNWSPYEGRDPEMKRAFGGAERGKGATYAWDGNSNIGSGRMEILETAVPSKILIKLDFFRPFEGHNTAEFTMAPQGDATLVTWAMYGPAPFLSKLLQLFVDMDATIGKDFEAGLANLKKLTEK